MSPSPPDRIAVIGPGLLGGSVLLALRGRKPGIRLSAWARRQDSVEQVLQTGAASFVSTDLAAVVAEADLVLLCTPLEAMPALARQMLPHLRSDCVVTDVGSVKTPVVSTLEGLFQSSKASFVGSHPMAGSERSGLAAARADLFDGAVSIITPTIFTTEAALDGARWLWKTLGCHVLEMSAEDHDRNVARVSHLPHLAAAALTLAALRHDPSAASCCGSGFRDSTRVASGDPALWTGIVSQNRSEVLAALHEARDTFNELIAVVAGGDDKALLHLLEEARSLRDTVAPG